MFKRFSRNSIPFAARISCLRLFRCVSKINYLLYMLNQLLFFIPLYPHYNTSANYISMLVLTEESYITQIEYGFDQHDVEIIDTAGQEEFMLFRDSSLAKGDAFLAMFAINSPESWYDVQKLRAKIIQENDGDERVPMVFIANKSVSNSHSL